MRQYIKEKGVLSMRRESEKQREWELRITEWEASGKSVRAFCIENGLRESQMHYWRKRLRGSQTDVHWIPVELDGSFGENSCHRRCIIAP